VGGTVIGVLSFSSAQPDRDSSPCHSGPRGGTMIASQLGTKEQGDSGSPDRAAVGGGQVAFYAFGPSFLGHWPCQDPVLAAGRYAKCLCLLHYVPSIDDRSSGEDSWQIHSQEVMDVGGRAGV
jgi:hypothetical protein